MSLGKQTDIFVVNKLNSDFIHNCDQLIRNGQGKQVLENIKSIPKKNIPRAYLSQIGNLLNRIGGSQYSLKLLFPYVRGSYNDLGTQVEKIVYAKSLIEVGAQREGIQLLRSSNSSDPSCLLTEAFYFFKSWNYHLALPLIQEYLQKINDPYKQHIGKINLSSTYIFLNKLDKAYELLTELEKNQEPKFKLLNGYIYELLGQVHFHKKQDDLARQYLNRSIDVLSSSNQKALLYPQKWLALLALRQSGHPHELDEIKTRATLANDFETLRDIDFWCGLITNDNELLSKVYYRTPFLAFRNRIPNEKVKTNWHWKDELGSRPFIDLFGSKLPMSFELTSQLFCYLFSDGYKPVGIGSIHSHIFKDDYYNPNTSPDKVYQVISRLNKILHGEFNYKIESINKSYYINSNKIHDFNYRIHKSDLSLLTQTQNIFKQQIINLTNGTAFSAKQISNHFNVSQRTANRWIKNLGADKIGQGRNTQFALKAS